jgi:hypothetical protein
VRGSVERRDALRWGRPPCCEAGTLGLPREKLVLSVPCRHDLGHVGFVLLDSWEMLKIGTRPRGKCVSDLLQEVRSLSEETRSAAVDALHDRDCLRSFSLFWSGCVVCISRQVRLSLLFRLNTLGRFQQSALPIVMVKQTTNRVNLIARRG